MIQHSVTKPDVYEEKDVSSETEFEHLYRVIVHNDDVTPYDFVIVTLVQIFKLNTADAERITWEAHNSGQALVAILVRSDAQKKVGRAHFAAALEGFPLTFTIEPEEF